MASLSQFLPLGWGRPRESAFSSNFHLGIELDG